LHTVEKKLQETQEALNAEQSQLDQSELKLGTLAQEYNALHQIVLENERQLQVEQLKLQELLDQVYKHQHRVAEYKKKMMCGEEKYIRIEKLLRGGYKRKPVKSRKLSGRDVFRKQTKSKMVTQANKESSNKKWEQLSDEEKRRYEMEAEKLTSEVHSSEGDSSASSSDLDQGINTD
jgi:hypothetical protein